MTRLARCMSLASLGALLAGVGCGGGGAKARLQLENATGAAAAALSAQSAGGLRPSSITLSSTHYFAAKLASVYLAEDIDPSTSNNKGPTAMLWVSPHCTSGDDCDFFDFARPTATVNADLNSQELDVDPGTYRYVRMEFCYHGMQPTQPNVEWSGGSMTAPHAFLSNGCGVTSAEFDPPLVLRAGDSVSVSLGYDLSSATSVGQPDPTNPDVPALTADDGHGVGFSDCVVNDPNTKTCFALPAFTPAAAKSSGG